MQRLPRLLWVLALCAVALPLPVSGQHAHAHGDHDQHGRDGVPRTTAVVPVVRTPLGDRVGAADPGDTIRLAAGVHRGPIVVDRPIVLLGEAGAVIDGGGTGTVVTLAAPGTVLRTVTVRNGGTSLDHDEAGVKLVRCHRCTVADVTIEQSLHGIYLLESNDVVLERNRIRGYPSLREARRGNGIHLFNSMGTAVRDNRITGVRDGIYFSFSSGSEVVRNEVTGVRYGLHYMYSDDNRFSENRFTRNAAGAAIMFSKRIRFEGNVFADHVGYRAYGLLLQTSDDILAVRNTIAGNLVGVFLDNASRNVFRENRIVGNGTGIDVIASAQENTFVENVIAGNRTSVRTSTGGSQNRFSADGRGNFWGDRAIFDLDADGIGDRPYRPTDPFGTLAASRPVLEAFAMTPAARVLSWAERAFPVFDLPDVEDAHPLVAPPAGLAYAQAPRPRTPVALALALLPFVLVVSGLRRHHRRVRR